MDKQFEEYKSYLTAAEQKMQEEYDKTIISLSGGALGISFAFIKDVIGSNPIHCEILLTLAWVAWTVSITVVLVSYFTSRLGMVTAINQFNNAVRSKTLDKLNQKQVGGWFSFFTSVFNVLSGLSFVIGIILIIIFVANNFGGQNGK